MAKSKINEQRTIGRLYKNLEMVNGLVSIIVPCYNHAEFLVQCVASCLEQSYKNIEIICVNDGSTDDSLAIMYEFEPDIKVINQPNKGLSAARNAGIAASKGDYILTLDADDFIRFDFIEKTIGINDIVSTYITLFGHINCNKPTVKLNPTYQDFYKHNHINCCSLYKREIWDKIGGYDENMKLGLEDWDFWLRATKAGYNVTVVPEHLFYYRKHANGSMVDIAKKNYREIEKYIKSKS